MEIRSYIFIFSVDKILWGQLFNVVGARFLNKPHLLSKFAS